MRKLFGTDGIRGKANIKPMDALTAYRVGVAVGHYFRKGKTHPKILIGRDTRMSGTMLESALASGLCAVGCEAVLAGIISTPGVAFLTRSAKAEAGVVISASHNPFVDNGIKIFSSRGYKLPDDVEMQIESMILDAEPEEFYAAPHEVGRAVAWPEGLEIYSESLLTALRGPSLDSIRLVIDCANGASYRTAPDVFRRTGAEVFAIGIDPDGKNINKAAGSLHPEKIREQVLEHKADLGVAFDGDADRAIFVDHEGRIVDGDQIMAICAKKLKEDGKLARDTLVATVMSNIGLDRAMSRLGITTLKTAVGDRYVAEEMLANGYNFGGEQSGHLIFMDHSTTGDGVLAALIILSIMADTGESLKELASIMTRYPQVLKNLRVDYKRPLEELPAVEAVIRRVEERLGREGRVLVRYSGTENKVRVMVEGKDEAQIDGFTDEILQALDAELN